MIIDDDSRNVFALNAVLRSRGYQVCSASNADEAFQLLKGGDSISVVLTDLMLPGKDGFQIIRELKEDEKLRDIPVVSITAKAMSGDREKALEAGADAYLSKPVDVDNLMALLETMLKRKSWK